MTGSVLVSDGFEAFTGEHLGLLALLVVGAVAVGWLGSRARDTAREERFRRAFAVLIMVFSVPMQVYLLSPGEFTLGTSLPLQLCDLGWMVAVYALWTRHELATAVLYFWGLSLTVQAAITPSLGETFPDLRYFSFWGMHFLTIWAAVYLVCSVGGPTWRGYRFAVGCTAVWAVAVLTFNAVTGANYGYLNRKPESASVLDLLGPWPVYVAAEVAILVAVWALMTWPWVRHGSPDRHQRAGGRPEEWARMRSIRPGADGLPPATGAHQGAGEQGTDTSGQRQE